MQSISLNLILISEFNLVFLGICSFGKIQIIDGQRNYPILYVNRLFIGALKFLCMNKRGAAKKILEEIESAELPKKTIALTEKRYKAVTYFTNNHHLMKYQHALKHHWPIGSGVTEAACKTLVKQRLCGSGMRWKSAGAEVLLETRSLIQSKGRWEQLWSDFMMSGKMLVDF